MTRLEMARTIQRKLQEESKLNIELDVIKKVLKFEEEEIFSVIATNDNYYTKWGIIKGVDVVPQKLPPDQANTTVGRENFGYTPWTSGNPKVEFTKDAKLVEGRSPLEYFELPEIRYTSAAHLFRTENGIPEIPEYDGLTYEQKNSIMKKADSYLAQNWKAPILRGLPDTFEQRGDNYRKKAKMNYNLSLANKKRGLIKIVGVMCNTKPSRRNCDVIDVAERQFWERTDAPEMLENILTLQDVANDRHLASLHPELWDIEQRLYKIMHERGQVAYPHVNLLGSTSLKQEWKYRTKQEIEDKINGVTPHGVTYASRDELLDSLLQEVYSYDHGANNAAGALYALGSEE